jgi:hypothetical protein
LKDPDRDYSEYSGTESTATRTAINILGNGHAMNGNGVPLAGPVKLPNDHHHRYSGDYSDMHVATKVGLTNNGYIPYNDYTRDYSPPNSMRNNNNNNITSLKNHLISSSGHSPLINSTQPITMNGSIDSNYATTNSTMTTMTLGRNRELRQDNGLPSIPLSTMPNGIISKYYTLDSNKHCCCRHNKFREKFLTQTTSILDQSLLNNVDIRFSATYGNPYLKNTSISPLPPPQMTHKLYTANPSVTPAPPPYNRSNNSNSSFSSSTTISNSGSLLGNSTNATNNNNNNNINNGNLGLSYPNSNSSSATISAAAAAAAATTNSQITSPSRQFILPANGDLKKGSLATHV